MEKSKITVLKTTYKVSSKIEQTVILLRFIMLLKKIKLSDTNILVLAHFMTEGYNEVTKEQVVNMKLVKNKASLANCLTSFRDKSILIKEKNFPFNEVLDSDFKYPITEKININITLDNS